MGTAKVAVTAALPVAAKIADRAVFPVQAVVERPAIAAGIPELDMVPDFLGNCGWVLAKFTPNAIKRFFFY